MGAIAFMALSGMLLDRLPAATSATKIAAELNVHATQLDQALADTVAGYRTNTT